MASAPGSRTALVTGASSGIGRATARLLVDRGYAVIGTCRHPEQLHDRLPGVTYRSLDLSDHGSIDGLLGALRNEGRHVDVLVNNAGESQSGPLEDLPTRALQRVFDINVLGPMHLTQRLLPGMRRRGYGRVVMVGSMVASFPVPYRSSYVASKAAVKGFATSARFEMAPYGVWLTTVEPGSIRTGISKRRTNYVAAGSPHEPRFRRMLKILDRAERHGVGPDEVARVILRAIESERPAPLYAIGSNAPVVFMLRRLLPRPVVERVVSRKFGLGRHGA